MEQQIHAAIASKAVRESSSHPPVLVVRRSFRPESVKRSSPVHGMYFDCADDQEAELRLRDLQERTIPGVLEQSVVAKHEIDYQNGIDLKYQKHKNYLTSFQDQLCGAVLDRLDLAQEKLAITPDTLVDEMQLHLTFAKVRSERFSPTNSSSAALAQVEAYLQGPGGQAQVLVGRSGAGKTYVMAKASVTRGGGYAVVRFLGTSSQSADVQSLLQSVCQQLYTISKGKEAFVTSGEGQAGLGPCPTNFQELCPYFKTALEVWSWGPLVLFFDSVDQLDDSNGGRNLDWLPLAGYSSSVHLVISTLPDESNPEVGRPFWCYSNLYRRHQNPTAFIQVEQLKDVAFLTKHLLNFKERKLTEEQMDTVVKAVERAEDKAQTPLMITLLAHLAGEWRSSHKADSSLPTSVRAIIEKFFLELEKKHGRSLVQHVLAIITLARQGVTVSELQGILSLDDEVLAEVHEWWVTPMRKMPSAPLALLLADLDPFLSRRGQAGGGELLFWYHRQFWEAVWAFLLKCWLFCAEMHRLMAEYFSGVWWKAGGDRVVELKKPYGKAMMIRVGKSSGEEDAVRHTRPQPLYLTGSSVWHPDAHYNERRCVEALHHILKELDLTILNADKCGGALSRVEKCIEMAEAEISVEGVCARSMVGEVFSLVSQMAKLSKLCSGRDCNLIRLEHFERWVKRDAHELNSGSMGRIVSSLLRQPKVSKAQEAYLLSRSHVPGLPLAVLGGPSDFDSTLSILRGHQSCVNCTDWHGDYIVSGDDTGSIFVWDSTTGEKTRELVGHAGSVKCVKWSCDGSKILSASSDNTVIVWNASSGEKLLHLTGHLGPVMTIAWNGSKIISGSQDKTVLIWMETPCLLYTSPSPRD